MDYGTVLSVDTYLAGSELAASFAIGATSLVVQDAADFVETGGLLRVLGGTLAYSSVNLDTETLTLTEPTTFAASAGDRVDVHPAVRVRTATVRLDEAEDAVPARLGHAASITMPEGVRERSDAEQVAVELIDGEWWVTQVYGRDGRKVGQDAGTTGHDVLYTVPGPSDSTGVADPIPVMQPGRQYLVRDPATGDVLGGVNPDGSFGGMAGDFMALSQNGVPVADMIAAGTSRVIQRASTTVSRGPYSSLTGYLDFGFQAALFSQYRVNFSIAYRVNSTSTPDGASLRITYTEDGTEPTAASPNFLLGGDVWIKNPGSSTRTQRIDLTESYFPIGSSKQVRIRIHGQGFGAGSTITFDGAKADVYYVGPYVTQGGILLNSSGGGGSGSSQPLQQYGPITDYFSWSECYTQFGVADHAFIGNKLRQGTTSGVRSNYASILKIPSAVRNDLNGATEREVWLRLSHAGPYASGTARIGTSSTTASSPPSSMPAIDGAGGTITSGSWSKGVTRQVKLPDTWVTGIADGSRQLITLGATGLTDTLMDFYDFDATNLGVRAALIYKYSK